MKAYPEYKPSGIDWLGEIPSHWKVSKLKHYISISNGSDPSLDGNIPVYGTGELPFKTCGEFKEGPTVLLGRKGSIDTPHWVDGKYWNVDTAFDTKVIGNYNMRYFWYLANIIDINPYKSTTAVPSMTQSAYDNMLIPAPSIEEQEVIAGYLDEVVAKVDSLIAEKQAQVEDLRKYRTSLITETVTRGLNPNVPIKQTNSEWFPKIPVNWSIEKFKYQATVKANLVHPTDYTQHPQISPDSIEKNTGRLLGYKSVEVAGIISDNHLFYKGQIIYSKIRPNLNKVIIAPFDGLCSADMYPIETLNNVRYFQYLMLSNPFVSQVSVVIQDRVKMPKINQVELGEILILVPPISEQQQIADYLDEKTAKIDSLIEELEAQLSDLATYKQAVITEAVTGKVDVRDWTPKN